MSEPQPIRFSVPEDGFDLSLLPEAARQRGSEALREAVTRYYKDGRTVSALQVACILDVGVQLLLPGQDAGIDLAREYELARGMVGGGESA